MLGTTLRTHCLSFLSLSLAFSVFPLLVVQAVDLPTVEVTKVRRVFDNGEHNAFTDLIRFQDAFYLAFRSCPDGHMVHPSASILILRSHDLETWEQVHRFSVPQRDTRDPHFLIFQHKLFVYTGTWYCGEGSPERSEYDLNTHLGYASYTSDGSQWTAPTLLEGTFGHYVWRAAAFDGKAYLCARRKAHFAVAPKGEGASVESAMLESDDGLVWRKRSLFQEEYGDETAFQFLPNGKVIGIGRRGSREAQWLTSEPPYNRWQRAELDRYIGGPLLKRWGNRWVVGGRNNTPDGPRTRLCWLTKDKLHEFATLPSAGDNSYPGLLIHDATHATVSWYSSHEKDASGSTRTAIYMANLRIVEPSIELNRQRVSFQSSWDDTQQESYLTIPQQPDSERGLTPLVVSLHSWSGDLEQRQPELEKLVAQQGWYCLQPNFRGINKTPQACGSPAAIRDIADAVDWAIQNHPIDPDRVYLTGTSGGGHMTMMMAAKYPQKWAAASAWVGISDLSAWYEKHKDGKYGAMMRDCCGGAVGDSAAVDRQYEMRSPLPLMKSARGVALDISAGIHDGHTGSVPIRHSLDAFNELARALGKAVISESEISALSKPEGRLASPQAGDVGYDETFGREYYLRRHAGRARVTIFEGGHEGIASATMAWFVAHPRRLSSEESDEHP